MTTLIENILARASGKKSAAPGNVVIAEVDGMVMHEISGYLTTRLYDEKIGLPIKNPERLHMVFDHIFSPPREHEAEMLKADRAWARKNAINLYDCGSGNIHNAVFQAGAIGPGMVLVGSDSHTPVYGAMGAFAAALGNDSHAGTVFPYSKAWFKVPSTIRINLHGELAPGATPRDIALWLVAQIGEGGTVYKALEFGGPFIESLSLFDRWLFPLINVDVGAKCSYIVPDQKVFDFAEKVGAMGAWRDLDIPKTTDADFEKTLDFDISKVGPQIACPPTVGNVKDARLVAGETIHYAELGGHGGGRIEDIRTAAKVFENASVNPQVRFNIVPSSRNAFADALKEGLVEKLHNAGALWFPPSTGSNQAVNMGALADGEAMISTHSRNFPGRNGSPLAKMYLASAHTVAASAKAGHIVDVREDA